MFPRANKRPHSFKFSVTACERLAAKQILGWLQTMLKEHSSPPTPVFRCLPWKIPCAGAQILAIATHNRASQCCSPRLIGR